MGECTTGDLKFYVKDSPFNLNIELKSKPTKLFLTSYSFAHLRCDSKWDRQVPYPPRRAHRIPQKYHVDYVSKRNNDSMKHTYP